MKKKKVKINFKNIMRWIARIGSLLVLALAISILLTPMSEFEDRDQATIFWVLTGIWLVGILGLLISWKWELGGAILSLAALISRDMFYYSLSGRSFVDFNMVWLPILIPALLFIIVWWMDHRDKNLIMPWKK